DRRHPCLLAVDLRLDERDDVGGERPAELVGLGPRRALEALNHHVGGSLTRLLGRAAAQREQRGRQAQRRQATGKDRSHDQPRMMRGVMKISSSCAWLVSRSFLKSQPSSGMRLRPGVRLASRVSVVARMPPMTVVAPSGTCTLVRARSVRIDGPADSGPSTSLGVLFSSAMLMMTVSAGVILGVTSSFSAASWNWIDVLVIPPVVVTT